VRYLLAFKQNYFGANVSFVSSDEFRAAGGINLKSRNAEIRYYEAAGVHNAHEMA
jgi:hypothetical protein